MTNFRKLLVTDFFAHVVDEDSRLAARAELIRRGNGKWLAKLDEKFGHIEPAKTPRKTGQNPKTKRANKSGATPGSTAWWNAYHGRKVA